MADDAKNQELDFKMMYNAMIKDFPDEIKDPFADVIGYDQLKLMIKTKIFAPLQQNVLKSSQAKGVLFFGPPGTGKTNVARAIALGIKKFSKDRIVRFFSISGSDIKSKYFGEDERKIRNYFKVFNNEIDFKPDNKGWVNVPIEERSKYFTAVFFDEIDSVAGIRGKSGNPSTLQELLVQMDGFGNKRGGDTFIMAATNRPSYLDSAIERRLGSKFYISLPNLSDRDLLFKFYLEKSPYYKTMNGESNTMITIMEVINAIFIDENSSLLKRLALFSASDFSDLVKNIYNLRIEMMIKWKWIKENGKWMKSSPKPNLLAFSSSNTKKFDDIDINELSLDAFKFLGDDDIKEFGHLVYEYLLKEAPKVRKEELINFFWYDIYNEPPPKSTIVTKDIKNIDDPSKDYLYAFINEQIMNAKSNSIVEELLEDFKEAFNNRNSNFGKQLTEIVAKFK